MVPLTSERSQHDLLQKPVRGNKILMLPKRPVFLQLKYTSPLVSESIKNALSGPLPETSPVVMDQWEDRSELNTFI